MPELPEVETVRKGLTPVLEGQRLSRVVQRRPDLRFPFPDRFVERLTGRRVVSVDRRAKYLLLRLDDGQVLIGHLGMSGRMTIFEKADIIERQSLYQAICESIWENKNRNNQD